MSENANLEKIEVDGEEATLGEEGKYHYMLKQAKTSVEVKAVVEEKALAQTYVTIDNSGYELYEKEKTVNITSKKTEVSVKVKAENGNIEEYILVIEGLPDDTSIKEVVVNGEKATYIEGKNRYEIRSNLSTYNIQVTLNDILATLKLDENEPVIGKGNITVNKTGKETTVKVTVTAQNGIDKEEYIIAIIEKASNSNLDIVKVNGKEVKVGPDGTYKTGIPMTEENISVEAIAEDKYGVTTIDGIGQNSYIASKKDAVIDNVKLYIYEIVVTAEDGTQETYTLEVQRLEVNYNIQSVLVGKDNENLEEATLEADGKYHYKIDRVEEAIVQIELQSEKSSVEIDNGKLNPANVMLRNEITEVPIRVIAEDGSYEDMVLVIEKKSNDVLIKQVVEVNGTESQKIEKEEDTFYVYINDDTASIDLDIILNDKNAKLKLSEEDVYETGKITRTVDLSTYEQDGGKVLTVEVQAEDGVTTKEYIINFAKKADLSLKQVSVNGNIITYNEQTNKYEALVPNQNAPLIEAIANGAKQTVTLINEAGTEIGAGIGVVTKTETLSTTKLTDTYTIRVTAKDRRKLWIQRLHLRDKAKIDRNRYKIHQSR
ncbi:MAG: hypothetical protein HFJ24_00020 [Clostridia bacterium]|nr:hypothetical protein [Clostridia bacterium]MCI9274490.1 hypothetical protein [Clostridia bacterium]